MPTSLTPMTSASVDLFKELAHDAGNWNGTPMVDCRTNAQKGNLTNLKRHGVLTTFESDGCYFVDFTDKGRAWAAFYGIEVLRPD